ncbi:conserved hypothetical protein [Salmonella phage PVPSE1]|uniref:Uncharacterized protein 68 n=2 Tax=Seunavirus TaxID=1914851 RepID=G3BLT3_9CAUD|nr:hypothetical protein PVP-SE1_gp067 [Salmonella phage PVPSE1]YP_009148816.1 hypothetical protein ACQ19_gp020 [Salmonella phage SSE121]ADP02463.1 conserved hypothetical protein [Salmonella phage PVPSE1]AFU63661.1 hypothetical protein [Salmonella phage SSE121]
MVVYAYTPLIRTSDGKYPVYLSDFRADNPNVSTGSWIYSENLVELGYFPVIPKEMPEGDVVTEGAPHFNDQTQEWEQTWDVRDFTEEEIAANLVSAKDQRKADAQTVLSGDINIGIPYPYDEREYQVRVKSFDLATLLTIKNVLDADGSETTNVYPFQFLDGYKADFTHSEMTALINSVSRSHYELMKSYWTYIDSVDQATSVENIPQLPSSFL